MTARHLPEDFRSVLLNKLDSALMKGWIKRRQFLQWSLALGVSLKAATALADTLDAARRHLRHHGDLRADRRTRRRSGAGRQRPHP
jgi:hypothetical protein